MRKSSRAKRRKQKSLPRPLIVTPPAEIAALIDRASEGDRVWFELHPGEDVRLRPIIDGEFWPNHFDRASHVIVQQVRPGFRLRLPVMRLSLPAGEWIQ